MQRRQTPPAAVPEFQVTLPYGLPEERAARIAARRAFVGMKLVYLSVSEQLEGDAGERLRPLVRHAVQPLELLALQGELLDALSPWRPAHARLRLALRRASDVLFDSEPVPFDIRSASAFMPTQLAVDRDASLAAWFD